MPGYKGRWLGGVSDERTVCLKSAGVISLTSAFALLTIVSCLDVR